MVRCVILEDVHRTEIQLYIERDINISLYDKEVIAQNIAVDSQTQLNSMVFK